MAHPRTRRWLATSCVIALVACSADRPRETAPEPAKTSADARALRRRLREVGAPLDTRLRAPIAPLPDHSGRMVMRRRDSSVFFTPGGLAWSVAAKSSSWGLHLALVDARPGSMSPEHEARGRVHRFGAKSETDVPTYERVVWDDVYPNVDMVAEPVQAGVAYRFVLSPGAKVSDIKLRREGARAVRTTDEGRGLAIDTDLGALRVSGLRAFVVRAAGTSEERREELAVRHVVDGAQVSLVVDGWDGRSALVIDPTVAWSSFLGGSDTDNAAGVAIDPAGNVYVTGASLSSDFPTTTGLVITRPGIQSAFVTKINTTGNIVWSTFLGGTNRDAANAIAIDSTGNVFVTGSASSNDFPTPGHPPPTRTQYERDAFVAKLGPTGAVVWARYLGGSGEMPDNGRSIAVAPNGDILIAGDTMASDFPKTGAFDGTYGGAVDGFVTRLSADGAIVWSSYLGGAGEDLARGVGVDANGNALVTGLTKSADFPTLNAMRPTGVQDEAFVTKISPAGALVWSTHLGGSYLDSAAAIAVDATGNAYVTGATRSTDFPTNNGFQKTTAGADAFVTKLSNSGTLLWSTFFGGNGPSEGRGIAVDKYGTAVVVGSTQAADLPLSGPFDSSLGGSIDTFVLKIASGGERAFSSFLGGADQENEQSVAVDGSGNAFIVGATNSNTFPTTAGAFDATFAGTFEGFVVKLTFSPPGATCTSAADCVTGYCADGVCCESACTGPCVACSSAKKGSGADGVCAPVAADTDPRDACPADPGYPSSCKTDGLCDGASACRVWAKLGTACGDTLCSGGSISGLVCNGGGICATSSSPCSPYACGTDAKTCRSTCTVDTDCATTAFCGSTGACAPKKANAASCASAKECVSGYCADGVCCNSACGGQCEACNENGAAGTCKPVVGAPKAGRAACAGTGTACAGVCDGVNGGSCGSPQVGKECASACGEAVQSINVCGTDGTCKPTPPQGCNGFACEGTIRCKTSCATASDCAPKFTCKASQCVPEISECTADETSVVTAGKEQSCHPALCKGGKCVESCSSTADCSSGFICNPTSTKCEAAPPSSEDGGGCAIQVARTGSAGGAIGVVVALALATRRRRAPLTR